MTMQFNPYDKFTHNETLWVLGEFSDKVNGYPERFFPVLNDSQARVNYSLTPTIENGRVVDVVMQTTPHQEGASLAALDAPVREKFAKVLEWSAKRAGMTVSDEVLQAVRDGRNLEAERDTQVDFDRMTRNLDHDLEAAYMLRDSLREEATTALDEGRDDDAKAAMERLGEVKQSIQDYWNPHKARPVAERMLTRDEKEELEIMREVMESDLDYDAAKLAAGHFGSEAVEASERGDDAAGKEAAQKAEGYLQRALAAKVAGKQSFADKEKLRQENGGEIQR